jgi:hypothetical protein
LALLSAVLFLFAVQLLAKILVTGTGVSPVESFERALAMGVPVPLHGHKEGSARPGDGIEVGSQELGGSDVAADVRGSGWET